MRQFAQLTANGIITGSILALSGVSFAVMLATTKRFHIAYVASFTLAAYTMYWAIEQRGWPVGLAMALGMVLAVLLGAFAETTVYRPIADKAESESLIPIFVASLGITIAVQSLLQLKFGSNGLSYSAIPVEPWSIGDIRFTSLDVVIVVTCLLLVICLWAYLRYSSHGTRIRAVQVNPDLASVVGISHKNVNLMVFCIGSALAGVLGILWGQKYALTPNMGMAPIFIAFVVAFVAGSESSPLRIAAVGIGIGLVQSWSGLWLSATWSPLVVFSILIIFLVLRSLDVQRPSDVPRMLAPSRLKALAR